LLRADPPSFLPLAGFDKLVSLMVPIELPQGQREVVQRSRHGAAKLFTLIVGHPVFMGIEFHVKPVDDSTEELASVGLGDIDFRHELHVAINRGRRQWTGYQPQVRGQITRSYQLGIRVAH
jgi:hypothetical protein